MLTKLLNSNTIRTISAFLGRDVSGEIDSLKKIYFSLGSAMTPHQQMFTSEHWKKLSYFLSTEEGQIALQTFISDFEDSLTKK